mgnify:CR=1 FL=1
MSSVIVAAPLLVRQAVREHRSGRLESAADLYERALSIDPADPDALHLHLQRGDAMAAVPFAAKAVLAEPAMAHAYNNLGLILKGAGQAAAAARCYLQATLVSPKFAEAHSNLGVVLKAEGQPALAVQHYVVGDRMPDCDAVAYNVGLLLMRLGQQEDALVHLRRAVELAPERDGARHLIAAIEGETTTAAPRSYVRSLFDSYASRFDSHLVGELRYRAHQETVDLLDTVAPPGRRFALTYDLGCGTGLVGELVRSRTDRLVGIDLSPKMLERADRKGIYDTLICGDINDVLDQETAAPDLTLATDVLIYLGDLDGTIERLASRMAPGGLFAFSIETAAEGLRWFLRPSGRYAHGADYITETLERHGLRLLASRPIMVRQEAGEPLDGAIYLAVKPTGDGAPV